MVFLIAERRWFIQSKNHMVEGPIRKPFLKWAGAKTRIAKHLRTLLPNQAKRYVEPFLGAGALFLNTNYSSNLLADSNPDLVSVYQILKDRKEAFVATCESLFIPENNRTDRFYALREEFNDSDFSERRAVLFIYLNRHCFNGLCRYNKAGKFNTPFGRYVSPYFPRNEMRFCAEKLEAAEIRLQDFKTTFNQVHPGDVVYCDPPYIPLSATANFTDYAMGGFSHADQQELAKRVLEASQSGAFVMISNHNTPTSRVLYKKAAKIVTLMVSRTISCNGEKREKAEELIAVFSQDPNWRSQQPEIDFFMSTAA